MKIDRHHRGPLLALAGWLLLSAASLGLDALAPGFGTLPSGHTVFALAALLAMLMASAEVLALITHAVLAYQHRPPVEGVMVGRVYRLLAVLAVGLGVAYGMGKLATFGTFFSLFGGMLLGWSLQAPVSGFAAYILVSVKRPFRPGDRVQFPSLGLTGDVAQTGPMYTYLNQVGGTIGSEEAVGRYILVPNAMLFSQVVINYTVVQESPYMLDEVVVRITYDSSWDKAERLMTEAAKTVTGDIVEATGVEPYIRSDLYDYGVYLRLRYQTRVKDRAEISYRITKLIFESVQRDASVDLAIPFVYSYRSGADRKDDGVPPPPARQEVRELELDRIVSALPASDDADVAAAAKTAAPEWLRQPIVVSPSESAGRFQIVAGHLQFEICRHLGWKTIPAVIVDAAKPAAPVAEAAATPAPARPASA
jgi:small-conductance mechanosensitive channel